MGSHTSASTNSSSLPGTGGADQRARKFLEAGQFRKARDEFKALCKVDRPKYLPLLIQANIGLASEMMNRGLVSDAEQVIAYLRTIATPEQLRTLELTAIIKAGSADQTTSAALQILADVTAAISDRQKYQLADQLILAFNKSALTGEPNADKVLAEIRAVHDAIEAIASRQFDRAAECLRPLPSKSPFGQWKWLTKGMIAFYKGDPTGAARCFESLTADGAPSKAARPYLLLMGRVDSPKWTLPQVDVFCRLIGHPAAAPELAAAEEAWRSQRYADSYQHARRLLKGFTAGELEWTSGLADFYFNSMATLPSDYLQVGIGWLRRMVKSAMAAHPIEIRKAARTLMLALNPAFEMEEVSACWDAFLRLHQAVHGDQPKFAAAGYALIGDRYLLLPPTLSANDGVDLQHLRLPEHQLENAVRAYTQSITLDPTRLAPHLKLAGLHEMLGQESLRNRLLDEMVKRFPDEKAVLIQAGMNCLERKAFQKGITYLERAVALDRLDPQIPGQLLLAYLQQARQYHKKHNSTLMRAVLAKMPPLLTKEPFNPARSHWCGLLWEGLLERAENPDPAAVLLDRSRTECPHEDAWLLYAHLSALYLGQSGPYGAFLEALKKRMQKTANAAEAWFVLVAYTHWLDRITERDLWATLDVLDDYLNKAAKKPFSLPEARRVIGLLFDKKMFPEASIAFAESALRLDRKEPFFRIMRIMASDGCDTSPDRELHTARDIVAEAHKRGDDIALRLAEKHLKNLQSQYHAGSTGFAALINMMEDQFGPLENAEDGPFPEPMPIPSPIPPRKLPVQPRKPPQTPEPDDPLQPRLFDL